MGEAVGDEPGPLPEPQSYGPSSTWLALSSAKNVFLGQEEARWWVSCYLYYPAHLFVQIHYLLIQNRQGKVRLAKWYTRVEDEDKRQMALEIHRLVNSRHAKFTNFVEVGNPLIALFHRLTLAQFHSEKIVYRRYAGLFFSICVDREDNELAALEFIHLLVEVLDNYFGNVCELDLVFNFHKVISQ